MLKRLLLNEMKDEYTKENFLRLQDFFKAEDLFRGAFKFYEFTFTQAVTNLDIAHNLGFVPKDIIQTSLTGLGALIWNYDRFTRDFINVTTSDACVVRAFIGRVETANQL